MKCYYAKTKHAITFMKTIDTKNNHRINEKKNIAHSLLFETDVVEISCVFPFFYLTHTFVFDTSVFPFHQTFK